MDIPPKVRIPICIEQGSVFNFFIDFGDPKRQPKNRYFVVINRDPKKDTVLLMLTPTKQVQKKIDFIRRSGISEKTIIKIKANEYIAFPNDSAFNCNELLEVMMEDLIRKIEDSGSMDYPKISENILKRIIEGIRESPIVSQELKDLI